MFSSSVFSRNRSHVQAEVKVGTHSHAKYTICIMSHSLIPNTSPESAVTAEINPTTGFLGDVSACQEKWEQTLKLSWVVHESQCGKVYNS